MNVVELIGATRAVAPVLRRDADQADADSRLTEATGTALRQAGLFRLGVPRSLGGYEIDPATCLDTTSELALACPSSAWVVVVSYVAQHVAASFGERVRDELWGKTPDVAMCGAFHGIGLTATPVDGGQLVSGRWPWASGAYQAGWAALGVPIVDRTGTVTGPGVALVPVDALTVEDTWDMVGMRGTGSNTLVADQVFVPEYRIRPFAGLLAGSDDASTEPLYRIPVGSMTLMSVGPLLGIARSVYEQIMTVVDGGKPLALSTYRRLADSPSVQAALADAATLIDSAELHLTRSAEFLMTAATAGTQPDLIARARVRMDAGHAAKCLREAVQLLLTVGGAGTFARTKLVLRYWHDLETASRHPSLNGGLNREIYGRALVGSQEQVIAMV